MSTGPVMRGRYWPVEAAPPAVLRVPVPSSAFTPAAVDAVEADRRMARITHDGARDVVTLTVVAQAVEEIGRHHAGHQPACDTCYWLSKAIAAVRAREAM